MLLSCGLYVQKEKLGFCADFYTRISIVKEMHHVLCFGELKYSLLNSFCFFFFWFLM